MSLRWRILSLVLGVALVPLGLAGLWVIRDMGRTAEALLAGRVGLALERTAERVAADWIARRSQILDLADAGMMTEALLDPEPGSDPPEALVRLVEGLPVEVWGVSVRDVEGRVRWTLGAGPPDGPAGSPAPSLTYPIPMWDGLSDRRIGTLEVSVDAASVLPLSRIPPEAAGMTIGIFDLQGRTLRPVPFDATLLNAPQFRWGGERWVTRHRELREPPLRLVLAAPASPMTIPFQRAARQGAALLFLVLGSGFLVALALSRRLTRSLEELSEAAQAVSSGDFDRRITGGGGGEIERVAAAFNVMTENLQETMSQLARQESLAAIGEFAASLAHEIRNPLTAVRVDLQRVQAELPLDSPLSAPIERSLAEVDRLNQTLEETLRHARIGRSPTAAVDLREVLMGAATAARPFFEARSASLEVHPFGELVRVGGDAEALRHVFLNLLRNAAEALGPGGLAELHAHTEDHQAVVVVADNGPGIPEGLQARVFEPLFTTRAEGTGLGLAIVRRTVEAHNGEVRLDSGPGRGTSVTVRLPEL